MLRISECDVKGNSKRGVYFYGKQVFTSEYTEDYGIRSYQFFLALVEGNTEIEKISFIDTVKLKDLPRKVHKFRKVLTEGHTFNLNVDWETYLQTSHKKLYDYHIERANRKLTGNIPINKEIVVPWISENDKLDFLEFTNNYHFGFELEGKHGAAAYISSHQMLGYSSYPFDLAPLEEVWSHYDLPYGFTYKSTEDKIADFRAFPLNIQLRLAKKYINSIKNSEEYLPYHVYLAGEDDFSYSKYFCTLEEAEQEMAYLRMMQPLDFKLDVIDRGYLFTN
jgi:hypothetical protein